MTVSAGSAYGLSLAAHVMVAALGDITKEQLSSMWPFFLISAPTPSDGVFLKAEQYDCGYRVYIHM